MAESSMSNDSVTYRLVVIAIALVLACLPARHHPDADAVYPVREIKNIWTEDQLSSLLTLLKKHGRFESTTKDSTPFREDIGEAHPYNRSLGCPHPLMQPNLNESHCIFAPRMDIGRHYVKTGGKGALKEGYNKLVSRLLSFSKFFIAKDEAKARKEIPGYATLFDSSDYQDAVAHICPGKPVLDPFQLGVIVQVPGQQVPMHFDAPWFVGADRLNLPVWLLVVMHRSGLFREETVAQIQGVAYVHDWGSEVANMSDAELNDHFGGGFFHHSQGERTAARIFAPRAGNAILLDGSRCAHGTELYKAGDKHQDLPMTDKSDQRALVYSNSSDGEHWKLVVNGATMTKYAMSDLRIALVWRSKCFASKQALEDYQKAPRLQLDDVLGRLKQDLTKRGLLRPNEDVSADRLGELLLDTYVHYPMPDAIVPVNYCAIPKLLPSSMSAVAETLLSPVCRFH
eukprot:TRINITY_DN5977_c0_g1_i2.p1 TRINITY_DN5977_c0_g1~~TRINITY_DN5977_c0_g1_i2.p1  ORF type:complete len:466 (+),score=85.21 TRINITY_DN5977_c0_g1_i2:33-1400(+)